MDFLARPQVRALWLTGALVLIRSLSSLLVPILATLLVLTTPLGTGQGVHASELLHPLLPHVHLIDGRIVFGSLNPVAPDRLSSYPQSGPALGAGGAADAAGFGLAIAPVLQLSNVSILAGPPDRLPLLHSDIPAEFREPPEDPPPSLFA